MIRARVIPCERSRRFYDFHPINARQILAAVAARGIAPDAITEWFCSSMIGIITEAPRRLRQTAVL